MREATAPEMKEEMIGAIFEKLQDSPRLLEVLATSSEQGLIRSLGANGSSQTTLLTGNLCSPGSSRQISRR